MSSRHGLGLGHGREVAVQVRLALVANLRFGIALVAGGLGTVRRSKRALLPRLPITFALAAGLLAVLSAARLSLVGIRFGGIAGLHPSGQNLAVRPGRTLTRTVLPLPALAQDEVDAE
eukprot:9406634-Alexandrium_andersonii.AAC.1